MRLVFSINTRLAFYPPSKVMSIQWFLVGFIVASVSCSYPIQFSAFVVHFNLLASSVGLRCQWILCESGV